MDAKTTPTKATPKQRATSATAKTAKPVAAKKPARVTWPKGECRFRNAKGNLFCHEPVAHKGASCCKAHGKQWASGARLTEKGRVRFVAMQAERAAKVETVKLDPTLREKKPAANRTRPAQVAQIPAQNHVAPMPEASVERVTS